MSDIEKLGNEYIAAKEQLKEINNTINRDRWIVEELNNEIKEKEEEIVKINADIDGKKSELEWIEVLLKDNEKKYGEVRDGLKWEIDKLNEKKKKLEEKINICGEE